MAARPFFESVSGRLPELLAPVADLAMARAAIAGHADAIYVGFPEFNARGRSALLTTTELDEIITLCHRHGLHVYIALNILIFEHEFDTLVGPLTEVLQLRPDAFIVQDVAIARWLAELGVRIHASTQMTVADADSLAFYSQLPFARFVLAREMSLDRIKQASERAKELRREVECFVQGALCVSYSGQCLTSESFGGGSANRGRCAQSCRFLYDVVVDGKTVARNQYAVSARDLNAAPVLDALIDAGVDCFKIEGRLKEPQYVTASLLYHRNRMQGQRRDDTSTVLTPDLAFSRRSFPGWISGVNHQELVDAQIQSHVGEFIGPVVQIGRDAIVVQTGSDNSSASNSQNDIIPGDGIAIVNADGSRTGASVMQRDRDGDLMTLKFRRGASLQSITEGSRVFRNHSVQFERHARSLLSGNLPAVPVDVSAVAQIGKPLSVTFATGDGCSVTVQSEGQCAAAENSPLSEKRLKEELGALSGTAYTLRTFRLHADAPVFLHQREWKKCRREAVERLDLIRSAHVPITEVDVENALRRIRERSATTHNDPHAAHAIDQQGKVISAAPSAKGTTAGRLHLLVRDPEHVILLNAREVASVTLDFEYGRHIQKSLDVLKEKGIRTGIATYRVMADGEDLKLIEKHRPDVVLVRNAGALHRLKGYPGELIGDFGLNVANSISADFFLNQAGLQRIVPSLDLNAEELLQMIENVDSSRIEIILHQRIASFHMEYCLYAKYLSDGSDYRSCGIPCHSHRLSLRDPEGELHPVYTDFACRNTMYRSKPQSMAGHLQTLIKKGVQDFRIDLLDETKEAVRHLLDRYTSTVANPETGRSLIREEGWSEGQLRRNERSIKHRKEARR